MKNHRPAFIRHFQEIQDPDTASYPGSAELLSIGSSFSAAFEFKKLGIHHEVLPPGRRTSWPHAESSEEEFVFVIEGRPQVWVDGVLYDLSPGDGVGFVPGTGIAHCFINNSSEMVRLLVVGEKSKPENKCVYPLHPERNEQARREGWLWENAPLRQLGPDSAEPKKL